MLAHTEAVLETCRALGTVIILCNPKFIKSSDLGISWCLFSAMTVFENFVSLFWHIFFTLLKLKIWRNQKW